MGDIARVVELTAENLDYAYSKGVMTLYARSTAGRSVVLSDGRTVVDFARGSYLGLDNHPAIVRARSRRWSTTSRSNGPGRGTRLNFAITEDLETRLSDLLRSRCLVFSLVLTANMGVMPLLASGAFTGGVRPVVVFDKFAHATLSYHKAVVAANTEVVTIRAQRRRGTRAPLPPP